MRNFQVFTVSATLSTALPYIGTHRINIRNYFYIQLLINWFIIKHIKAVYTRLVFEMGSSPFMIYDF